jgi:signal transduction histidine kinase
MGHRAGERDDDPEGSTPATPKLRDGKAREASSSIVRSRIYDSECRLAADNAALVRLHEVSATLRREEALSTLLEAVNDAAITVAEADMGTLQLYDARSRSLRIVAQRGFEREFLDHFALVRDDDPAVCGQALRHGERVIVEDVLQSPIFLGAPTMEVMVAAGVRAVQSTPLRARDGSLLGMIATHWRKPHRPDAGAQRILDLLAREAADLIEHRRREEALRNSEARLAAENEALARLNEASSRLWRLQSLEEGLDEMLAATIELLGADMGNVQILDASKAVLTIAAQRGFEQDFLDFFREVSAADDSACGRALRAGARVVIEDVETDPLFAPYRPIARAAGFRAVQSTSLIGSNDAPLGVLSTHFRSPHAPSEQDLRRLDLYARLAADFIERCRADLALREADRRKDEFLATLAHELRNPLAPIHNGLLVLRSSGGQGPAARHVQEMMQRQVEHLVRLVDDLLEVSRISRGKIELKKVRLDMAAVINQAVDISKYSVDSAGLRLVLDLSCEPLIVDGDPVRLAQVIGNLLNNATKYTDPGGRIEVAARRRGDWAVVSVVDTGVGIPEDMLSRVFDLFSQVERTLARAEGGLGIGLALVKNLVELHGGRVEAQSEGAGRGSCFTVRLPVSRAAERALPEAANGMPAASSRRVLVIDDTADVADSLALLLKTLGAGVRVAYGGAEGLRACAEFEPDVVFLDIGMPEMDGFETARRMRELSAGRRATLVALTGWGEDKTRRRAMEAGFDRHLTKPMDTGELEALLAAVPPRGC